MAEIGTRPTAVDAAAFIAAVEPAGRRTDAKALDAMFTRVTGLSPRMWAPSIVGYGSYHYRYASGHEGRAARVGFSPRRARHSLYLLGCDGGGTDPAFEALLARLGKHKRGAACIYVNTLADIDLAVLEELSALSWQESFLRWPED